MVCHAIGIDNDKGSVSSNLCDSLVEVEVEVEGAIVALGVDEGSVTATLPVVGALKGLLLLLLLLLFDSVITVISSLANAAAANAAAFASLRLLGVGLVCFSRARSTSNIDLSSGRNCALYWPYSLLPMTCNRGFFKRDTSNLPRVRASLNQKMASLRR